MINKIIQKSVENSAYVFALTLIMVFLGWFSYKNLPIDAVPDITNVQVQINTPVPALSPETVEANITYPIENSMNSVPGAMKVRSITRFGLSQVTVIFEEGTDLYRARQLVSEQLQSIELTEDVQPRLGPISSGLGEIFHYTIDAKKTAENKDERLKQLMRMRTIQEWDIKPRLLSVKGVTEVNTIGGYPEQYYVIPDFNIMSQYGLNFEDIVNALKKNNFNTGGGFIQQTAEQLLVQGSGLYRNLDDIRKVPVKMMENLETVTLGQIASVKPDRELRTGAALYNGKEAIVGTVFMLLGENSRTVSIRIADRIEEIKKGLPDWVELKVLYNRSDLVNSTIDTVQKNLLYGAILVIIILFLLVGNVRAALITAVTIPLSLMGTFIFMKLNGVTGSLMSLGALDFGIIIDGAVIVMDNCARGVSDRAASLGRSLTRSEIRETVTESTIEIRKAAGFGQIIILVVFLPIFALAGVEGKMFRPMAISFCFALLSAFILSFTTIPALAGVILNGKASEKKTMLMRILERIYSPILEAVLKFKAVVISAALLLIIAAWALFSGMGGEFIPRLDEGSIAMQLIRPVNINIDRSIELESLSEKVIMEFEEVETVFSRIGTAEISVDPMGVNISDTFIMLKPKKNWPKIDGKRRTKDELANAMSDRLQASIPGQRILLTQPIEMRFNEVLEGVRSDISLKIYGDDLEKLESMSREVAELLQTIPGVGEVEAEMRGKSPLLNIVPNMTAINKLGASKETVLNTVKIAIGGENSGYLYRGMKKYPIIVRLPERVRGDINELKKIPVGISENFTLPLSSLAKLEVTDRYSVISRESSKRRAAVLINLKGRDTQSFVEEAKKLIDEKLKRQPGYYIEWGGNFKNLEKAKERLRLLTPIAMLLIFFMIYSAFNNPWQTLIIFSGVPFALVGGVFNLTIMGLPFSISAGVGFIALSGIAVLNGVVLISCMNQLKADGESGSSLVRKGAMLRLRPVMMTALTDILGFLPMMLATGVGAEVQKPLAAVVVGGVITSTLLTLVMIPILYHKFEDKMKVAGNYS